MSASKIIKQMLIERNKKVTDLAQYFGITRQNMSNRLQRDTFSYEDMVKIADFLHCDVKIIARDTGKEFW